jgi:hypothetical protein
MPDDARTLWVSILQLCIGETDGTFTGTDLGLMLPDDAVRRQAALEWLLASRGKFRLVPHTRKGGGWRVPNWTDHNSSVATVDKHRDKWRKDKKRQRARPNVPRGTPPEDKQMSTRGHPQWTKDKDKGFAVRGSNHAGTAEPNHAGTLTDEQQRAIVFGGGTA